jgi:hypothetical protein
MEKVTFMEGLLYRCCRLHATHWPSHHGTVLCIAVCNMHCTAVPTCAPDTIKAAWLPALMRLSKHQQKIQGIVCIALRSAKCTKQHALIQIVFTLKASYME